MLFLIEIITLIILVALGWLWMTEPNGLYEPFIVSIGFIMVAIEVYRRNNKTLKSVLRKKDSKPLNITPDRLASVCYRFECGEVKFLMIRSSSDDKWNFPKGMFDLKKDLSDEIKRIVDGEAGVKELKIVKNYLSKMIHYQKVEDEFQLVSVSLVEVYKTGIPKDADLGIDRKPSYFNKNELLQKIKEGRDGKDAREIAKVIELSHDEILLNNRKR